MMLIVWPVAQSRSTAAEQGERDVGNHDQRPPPVSQEQQHNQSGENRAQHRLAHQAADGVGNISRLIEGKLHIDIIPALPF